MSGEEQRPVLVTGFGPFHHIVINASWEAVKELEKLGLEHNSLPVRLETRQMEVAYDYVSSTLPALYEETNPRLCVHVGVSPYNVMMLEKYGRNVGYQNSDIRGRCPSSGYCVSGGPEAICSKFDVDKLCQKVTQKQSAVKVRVSEDAGRYLCDFIYYKSLHLNKAPVLFVHVPELGKPYSASELAQALQHLIVAMLDELH